MNLRAQEPITTTLSKPGPERVSSAQYGQLSAHSTKLESLSDPFCKREVHSMLRAAVSWRPMLAFESHDFAERRPDNSRPETPLLLQAQSLINRSSRRSTPRLDALSSITSMISPPKTSPSALARILITGRVLLSTGRGIAKVLNARSVF